MTDPEITRLVNHWLAHNLDQLEAASRELIEQLHMQPEKLQPQNLFLIGAKTALSQFLQQQKEVNA